MQHLSPCYAAWWQADALTTRTNWRANNTATYKSASYTQEETTRAGTASTRATAMDRLSDAQKVEIEMQHNGMSITQTLVLNAYNESNAEYGMRSDKLELLTGTYKIVGYKLLDKLDEVITGISPGADETF